MGKEENNGFLIIFEEFWYSFHLFFSNEFQMRVLCEALNIKSLWQSGQKEKRPGSSGHIGNGIH